MFLTTTPDLSQIMADGIQEGIDQGYQMLWDAVKQFAADNPLLAGAIVLLVAFNLFYPGKKKRRKRK